MKYKFNECIDLCGKSVDSYKGKKQYISTSAVNCNIIDESQIELFNYDEKPSRANLQTIEGSIIFAKMQNTKKTLIIDKKLSDNIYSTGFFAVKPKSNLLTINCLFYLLNSEYFLKLKDKNCSGATQKAITNEGLEKIEINIPKIEVQEILIKKLNILENSIKLYQSQLKKLDLLIKSRFVEMFDNNKYEEVNISEVAVDKPSNGYFAKREEYDDNGNVKILGVVNVVNTMYSKIENLPKTNAKQSDIEKYVIKYGDILFCRSSLVAEGIGKASVVPQNVENNTLFECHVIRLKLDLKKVIPEYLQVLTTTDYFRSQILTSAKTATMTTIGQDGIMKCNIKLPPLSVQKEFYDFVKQVDKSKFVVQKALDKTKMLMNSLMQEYFG